VWPIIDRSLTRISLPDRAPCGWQELIADHDLPEPDEGQLLGTAPAIIGGEESGTPFRPFLQLVTIVHRGVTPWDVAVVTNCLRSRPDLLCLHLPAGCLLLCIFQPFGIADAINRSARTATAD